MSKTSTESTYEPPVRTPTIPNEAPPSTSSSVQSTAVIALACYPYTLPTICIIAVAASAIFAWFVLWAPHLRGRHVSRRMGFAVPLGLHVLFCAGLAGDYYIWGQSGREERWWQFEGGHSWWAWFWIVVGTAADTVWTFANISWPCLCTAWSWLRKRTEMKEKLDGQPTNSGSKEDDNRPPSPPSITMAAGFIALGYNDSPLPTICTLVLAVGAFFSWVVLIAPHVAPAPRFRKRVMSADMRFTLPMGLLLVFCVVLGWDCYFATHSEEGREEEEQHLWAWSWEGPRWWAWFWVVADLVANTVWCVEIWTWSWFGKGKGEETKEETKDILSTPESYGEKASNTYEPPVRQPTNTWKDAYGEDRPISQRLGQSNGGGGWEETMGRDGCRGSG
ncbi:uncharacterized protein BDZ99DRAFT_465878 [Mytilinidion resinicola]|uniref:Uncharacterized protein n=1 Tax=Mytilinidion resinicola TaxID=574789 RepID=A0A6A6YBL8_9PEZI|nr:uncharacterized protein BDZ99DRAFT_465878 [Mytilinidion resinicola]KAF2806226.1 hypothetical protein BDZ99DRAFT_465878 [Mytilinidion resinicola]